MVPDPIFIIDHKKMPDTSPKHLPQLAPNTSQRQNNTQRTSSHKSKPGAREDKEPDDQTSNILFRNVKKTEMGESSSTFCHLVNQSEEA